jgi:hypothetical protein
VLQYHPAQRSQAVLVRRTNKQKREFRRLVPYLSHTLWNRQQYTNLFIPIQKLNIL